MRVRFWEPEILLRPGEVLFQTQTRLGWTLELRTRLKLVTSKPEVLAVTVLDFYDMLVTWADD